MREVVAPRVLSPDEASALVGTRAPADKPTPALVLGRSETAVQVRDETGAVIALVARMDDGLSADLHRLLPQVKWSTTLRGASGYKNVSATFGYAARKPVLKREACRVAALNMNQPDIAEALRLTARWCGRVMVDRLPEVVEHDHETLKPVLPDWRLDDQEGDLWTSGVVNKDSPMPYHRDGSNFPTWSAMPVIRQGVRGGALSMPEHGLTFPCSDSTVLFWWGQRLVHGVTPLRFLSRQAYRFTVVYYAMRGMKDCATYAREVADGQRKRTEREASMAARIRSGVDTAYGLDAAKGKPMVINSSLRRQTDRVEALRLQGREPIVAPGPATAHPGDSLLAEGADQSEGTPAP